MYNDPMTSSEPALHPLMRRIDSLLLAVLVIARIRIDTLGELMDFYAASDAAFVGGSLIAHGGHNPLEPLALGLPVISGEAVFNFAEIYAAMQAEGLVMWVNDAESLATAVLTASKIIENPRGLSFLAIHKGALGKLLDRIRCNG